jgi:hypothetical protein
MSLINRIETGYLQLLRVIVLLLASLAILGAVITGFNAVLNYNAKPTPVDEKIMVQPTAFSLNAAAPTTADSDHPATPPVDASALSKQLLQILNSHAKTLAPDVAFKLADLAPVVDKNIADPELGADYQKALNVYFDQVLSRKDVAAQAHNSNYIPMLNKIADTHREAWQKEKNRIADEQKAAVEAAQTKHMSAVESLYALGVLFTTFIMLILLVVLIKIERNLRGVGQPQA